ncbi:AcrR family transcriptional regulator [Cerasibacillus quisquiliarum]|uniref:TetR family transcriptional regulator n=1 Tax=Cerasibacillus quisquiliarum TaxID=227865 RepID=A0A511UZY5_9BACI|nr:TetR/AcrR family transcriptional regulator [Cerasibacillus quisquiliarum]MBB5146005.1 AcrR family transcriptional regulator [Cerasibacillus quisquiliarum]GEN32216.1 TetR family transcriptional regulator [Cerasibacillus quisquiliarum]
MTNKQILSSVKDRQLVEKRRQQIIKAAITLFKQKGFHRTTTREIAKQSGFSIGTLYEYIRTKEDILFLVCDSIYEQVKRRLEEVIQLQASTEDTLSHVVRAYFELIDDMQDEVVVMYQEVKSLKKESRDYVLQKEREMVDMFKAMLYKYLPYKISEVDAELVANNIFVQGQMWGFRRWMLQKQFTLETYIERQLYYLRKALAVKVP